MSFRWASDDDNDNDNDNDGMTRYVAVWRGMTLIYYKDIIQFYVLITIKLK